MCILAPLLLATAIALRMPVMTTWVRAVVAATLFFAVFTGLVYLGKLFQSQPKTAYPAVFFAVLLALWVVLGSKAPDVDALRDGYVKELQSQVGRRYVFGGENYAGIDCSGLARVALWQAMLKEGIREFNPYLLGPMLWKFWWRDMTAGDMGKSCYGYTVELGKEDKLAGADFSGYERGDMAVVGNSHVLIYIGGDKWIEATPEDGKVVINKAEPDSKRPYFNTRVKLMRWWILREQ